MAKTGSPENNSYPIYPSVVDFKSKNTCGSTCTIKKDLNHKITNVSLNNDITTNKHFISIYPNGAGDNFITFQGQKYYVSLMTLFYGYVHTVRDQVKTQNETELHILFKRGESEIILAIPVRVANNDFIDTTSIHFFQEILKPIRSKKNNISSIQLNQGILLEELIPDGGYCFYQSKSVKEKIQKKGTNKTKISGLQTIPPTVFYYKQSLSMRADDMKILKSLQKYEFIANDNPQNIGMFVYSSNQDFTGLSESKDNDIYIDCSPEMNETETTTEDVGKKDVGIFQMAMLIVVVLLIPPVLAFSNRFRKHGMKDGWGLATFAFTLCMLITCTMLFFNYSNDPRYNSVLWLTTIVLVVSLICGSLFLYNIYE